MAKKWNFKSWVKKLTNIRQSKKEEEVPFYMSKDEATHLQESTGSDNTTGFLNLPAQAFAVSKRPIVHQIYLGSFIFILCAFTGKILGLMLAPTNLKPKATSAAPITAKVDSAAEWQNKTRAIKENDLFNTTKPNSLAKKKEDIDKKCDDADTKSSLPIKLVDTTVLQDSVKSLAAVQVRSARELKRIREGESIDNMARIAKIQRLRVVLKNLQNGQCEFISHQKIDEENNLSVPKVYSPTVGKQIQEEAKGLEGIQQAGNKICISRQLINEKLKNLNQLLQDARALQVDNPDGTISFRIVEIQPGSIYSHLSIQNNDIIKSINGKPIRNLNEIMGLFGKLTNLNNVNIELERDGSALPLKYEFTQGDPSSCKE